MIRYISSTRSKYNAKAYLASTQDELAAHEFLIDPEIADWLGSFPRR